MLKISDLSTDLVRGRVSRVLKRFIGRGLTYENAREVAEVIDTDHRTVDSWRDADRAPQLEGFLRLLMVPKLGPALAGEILELVGYAAQPVEHGDSCVFHINAELVGALRELADMLADGRVDHREDPVWQAKALELAMKLIGHVNARRSANSA